MAEDVRPAIAKAFAGLWTALDAVDSPGDRTALLDCARSALDRGARSFHADDPTPRLVAGTFWIEGVVAEGPSSTVFKLRHRDLGSLHALKTLRRRHADDPVRTRLMLQEVRRHLCIRHPSVVAATMALRLDDGRPALLMDFVDGSSLADRVGDGGLGPNDAVALGLRLADALAAIHAAGLVHLDLTPANVLLPDGAPARAQLCDFGLSLPIGERRSADEIALAGTPGFTAPEQADPDWPADPRADLFALGILLARAVDARGATAPFVALVDALRAPAPNRRPPTAAAVAQALADLAVQRNVPS